MSSRIYGITHAVAIAAVLALCSPVFAQQSDEADAEMRIQQLENRLRQLTGQNEELQYRNRQLEERFNTRLFDRAHGHIALTPAGQMTLDYAERILALSSELDTRL